MSYPELISLPFHLTRGLYCVHGLMRLEPGRVIIECQPVENIIGLIKGPMRTIEIPFVEIADISLGKGPLGSRQLSLRTLYLQTLRRFPGAHEGELLLRIRRSHALLADDFVSRLELDLTEASLRRLEDPGEQTRQALPLPETKVEQLIKVWDGIKGLLR